MIQSHDTNEILRCLCNLAEKVDQMRPAGLDPGQILPPLQLTGLGSPPAGLGPGQIVLSPAIELGWVTRSQYARCSFVISHFPVLWDCKVQHLLES